MFPMIPTQIATVRDDIFAIVLGIIGGLATSLVYILVNFNWAIISGLLYVTVLALYLVVQDVRAMENDSL